MSFNENVNIIKTGPSRVQMWSVRVRKLFEVLNKPAVSVLNDFFVTEKYTTR